MYVRRELVRPTLRVSAPPPVSAIDERKKAARALLETPHKATKDFKSIPSKINRIRELVAAAHGISFRDLMGKDRFAHMVRAKEEAAYLTAKLFPQLSGRQLALYHGCGHTTFLYRVANWTTDNCLPVVYTYNVKERQARQRRYYKNRPRQMKLPF